MTARPVIPRRTSAAPPPALAGGAPAGTKPRGAPLRTRNVGIPTVSALLRHFCVPRIIRRAQHDDAGVAEKTRRMVVLTAPILNLLLAIALMPAAGCSQRNRADTPPPPIRTIVVAPVLNLSGSPDFDALKITDLFASECVSAGGLQVIPVNLALAQLAREGKSVVESPEDALALARAFGADATVVVAVTEYDPFEPPVIGLIVQWYAEPARSLSGNGGDPLAASRAAHEPMAPPAYASDGGPRMVQAQRVFHAADEGVLDDVRSYAARRDGSHSAFGWRKYVKSQELYVRYASSAMIRTILSLEARTRTVPAIREAQR